MATKLMFFTSTIAILLSINCFFTNSDLSIEINGNVIIEHINNNENIGSSPSDTKVFFSTTLSSQQTTQVKVTTQTTITTTTTTTTTTTVTTTTFCSNCFTADNTFSSLGWSSNTYGIYQNDTDMPNFDFATTTIVPSFIDCQAICFATSGCNHLVYTYANLVYTNNTIVPPGTCFLKYGPIDTNNPTPYIGLVSSIITQVLLLS
jgi:hypothetical protein